MQEGRPPEIIFLKIATEFTPKFSLNQQDREASEDETRDIRQNLEREIIYHLYALTRLRNGQERAGQSLTPYSFVGLNHLKVGKNDTLLLLNKKENPGYKKFKERLPDGTRFSVKLMYGKTREEFCRRRNTTNTGWISYDFSEWDSAYQREQRNAQQRRERQRSTSSGAVTTSRSPSTVSTPRSRSRSRESIQASPTPERLTGPETSGGEISGNEGLGSRQLPPPENN